MRARTSIHAFLLSLCHSTLLLGCVASWCGGCALKLPPPKTYHTRLTDQLLLQRLCPSDGATEAFSLDGDTWLHGAISCDHERATVVLLNNFDIRVRTITLTGTGEAQDEVSYLSTNNSPLEELLSLLATAQESPSKKATSGALSAHIALSKHSPIAHEQIHQPKP